MKADRAKIRKLETFADKLYQCKYLQENPYCIVCGSPASCLHHVVYKSQSNALRYSKENGIPICSRCHTRHHLSGDPTILGTIIKVKGMKWFDRLQSDRHVICKHTKEYLESVIERLSTKTPF